jgi:endoglucanase
MPPARWRVTAEAAIRAIRATRARNLVLVPGANWDGAHSWTEGGAVSNASAMDGLTDPAGPIAFEFHQYFDSDSSGTHPDCLSPESAVATLEPATAWLERGHRQGFLGEFGVTSTPACLATLDAVLGYLDRHRAAWIGWTYWAAGPWWGSYMFSAEPTGGQDRPQAVVLEHHLSHGATR